jgi:hypothetical protein
MDVRTGRLSNARCCANIRSRSYSPSRLQAVCLAGDVLRPNVPHIEPVSVGCRTGLCITETEIGKTRAETGAPKAPVWHRFGAVSPPETPLSLPKPRKCRAFSHTRKLHRRDRTGWLGREDSNLRIAETAFVQLAGWMRRCGWPRAGIGEFHRDSPFGWRRRLAPSPPKPPQWPRSRRAESRRANPLNQARTVTLCSQQKSSPFWIILLLDCGCAEHQMAAASLADARHARDLRWPPPPAIGHSA